MTSPFSKVQKSYFVGLKCIVNSNGIYLARLVNSQRVQNNVCTLTLPSDSMS